MADKNKADYQEGLEKSCADGAARNRDSYMHERPRERLCMKPQKLHEGPGKESCMLTVQHEAMKVTRTTWRRVVMILLHGAVSRGIGIGGLGAIFAFGLRCNGIPYTITVS